MSSLRGRVMLGAFLWTIGLLAVWAVVLTVNPSARDSIRVVHSHGHLMAVIAIGAMIYGLAVVRRALAPFDDMRARLSDVRKGTHRQLEGAYASEVQPLVDDLNALLAQSEQAVTRANAKAGDLAHGLKTPLAVLSNEAARLATAGETELSGTIAQQVALMQRHVEYHLVHARAAASGAALHTRCPVAASSDGLLRTLARLHSARGLTFDTHVSDAHAFRGRREDLDEMLGNLLDNACKWARSRVSIESCLADDRISVVVDDDGPGLDPSRRADVLRRGVRADERVPGSGLGLAIVRDLAELYGGAISLESSPLGGLRARLELPSL
jgi:signal transduction histidine kinase